MALVIAEKYIYMHIPKAGGNWLTRMLTSANLPLRNLEDKHATYEMLCGNLRAQRRFGLRPRPVPPYLFFAVVRNPLQWYESWFKYQRKHQFRTWGAVGEPAHWHSMAAANLGPFDDFNAFMDAMNTTVPGFVGQLYAAYTLNSGARVLRSETVREDLWKLNQDWTLGLNRADVFESAAENVSPKAPILWRRDIFERTVALEAATFARYGYDCTGVVEVA